MICTGTSLSKHLVHTVFAIFDEDGDGQLSYREFIAIMKDRLHRGFKVNVLFVCCLLQYFLNFMPSTVTFYSESVIFCILMSPSISSNVVRDTLTFFTLLASGQQYLKKQLFLHSFLLAQFFLFIYFSTKEIVTGLSQSSFLPLLLLILRSPLTYVQ